MAIAAGEKIPSVKVMYMGPEGPASMSSDELFGGKRVAVFGLPGAFTPVCSAQHLPGYVKEGRCVDGERHRHDRLRFGQRPFCHESLG